MSKAILVIAVIVIVAIASFAVAGEITRQANNSRDKKIEASDGKTTY